MSNNFIKVKTNLNFPKHLKTNKSFSKKKFNQAGVSLSFSNYPELSWDCGNPAINKTSKYLFETMKKEIKYFCVKVNIRLFFFYSFKVGFLILNLSKFDLSKKTFQKLCTKFITAVVDSFFYLVWCSKFIRILAFWSLILKGKFKNDFFLFNTVEGPLWLSTKILMHHNSLCFEWITTK